MDINKFENEHTNFILYTADNADVKVEVFLNDETIWLTQKAIGTLFGKSKSTISEHLKNIYQESELDSVSTVRKFRTVRKEGMRNIERDLEYYNLDVIISVGYRVNSYQATQFRIWATKTLKEFIIKGFVIDDERLKRGGETTISIALKGQLNNRIAFKLPFQGDNLCLSIPKALPWAELSCPFRA